MDRQQQDASNDSEITVSNESEVTFNPDNENEETCQSDLIPVTEETATVKYQILSRPKTSTETCENVSKLNTSEDNNSVLKNGSETVKTLKQKEEEYAEARRRILGDVDFSTSDSDDEKGRSKLTSIKTDRSVNVNGSQEIKKVNGVQSQFDGLTPAEILKLKIAQALMVDLVNTNTSQLTLQGASDESETTNEFSSGGKSESSSGTDGSGPTQSNDQKRKKKKYKKKNKKDIETPAENVDIEEKIDYERVFRLPKAPDGTLGFTLER